MPTVVMLFALLSPSADPVLGPAAARGKVGSKVTVEMTVKAAKDRLEKHGEIYLDAEEDFRSPDNFAIVITKAGAGRFQEAGVKDPAAHFKGKKVRATGTVKEKDKVPRIEIDDPTQLRVETP
jgi:hypothetical protein